MKKILALLTLIPTLINAEQTCYQRTTKRAARYAMSEGPAKYHAGSYKQKPVCALQKQQAQKQKSQSKFKLYS